MITAFMYMTMKLIPPWFAVRQPTTPQKTGKHKIVTYAF